ncbi:hypothetical protein QA612_07645 [Evansella sp. AB-P1]|uniref:hypothetical protein n=1 Tax=Evansella sp. AB-P1 TaxID=3037653 RepID=UPI00241E94AA|nr:hypothetical protein [Evansella sp. AB-P1]MDG5787365.1 hypothetical protein [Evansella sp. AB-P1]
MGDENTLSMLTLLMVLLLCRRLESFLDPAFVIFTALRASRGFILTAFMFFHRLREEKWLHSSRIYVFPSFAGL